MTISIGIGIVSITAIKELEMEFHPKFVLKMEWNDHRLTFRNLKTDFQRNWVPHEVATKLWLPQLMLPDTVDKETVTLYDSLVTIGVIRESTPDISPLEIFDEQELFPGSKNKLTFTRYFESVQRCEFELKNYPFDTQRCSIKVSNQVDTW